jgi:hypothetical protein
MALLTIRPTELYKRQEIELLYWSKRGKAHLNEAFDQTCRALSEEILADVNQWRAAHPQTTFQELEQALHERISRLEAQARFFRRLADQGGKKSRSLGRK